MKLGQQLRAALFMMILNTQYIITVAITIAVDTIANAHGICEVDLLESSGSFQSPNRTKLKEIFIHDNQSSNLTCRWMIFPQSGLITLAFTKLSMGIKKSSNECSGLVSLIIVDRNASPKEQQLCGEETPGTYFSKGPTLEIILKGQLLHPSFDNISFEAVYSTLVSTTQPVQNKCDPCGGTKESETGIIRSPNYPKQYPNNCDCKWTIYVRRGYIVRLKFWAFSLEPIEHLRCHDFIALYDGSSTSARMLGKFCGNRNPGTLRTTNNNAFIHFHSDTSRGSTGFELTYESIRNEEDLTSLRSIAAILGGVSFGIFIFLLLCSIVYKRYVSNDARRNTYPPTGSGDNDYLDAVQAAAPPSYQAVMADPEHYPRTPEITPAGSPNVTPSLLRRNLIRPTPLHPDGTHHLESLEEDQGNGVETPPPPYPGNVIEIFDEDDILIRDLPPPPTYEMVSDNEDHDEHAATWAPLDVHTVPDRIRQTQEGQSNSSSNTDSTTTQVTTCESSCCGTDELRAVDSVEGAQAGSHSCQSERGDDICVQCIEDSELDTGLRRQRSDSDLRENHTLLRTRSDEMPQHCLHSRPRSHPYNRRKKSFSDSSSDSKKCTRDKRKMKWRHSSKDRSLSVPSLSRRGETAEQNNTDSPVRNSPNTIRSLFTRRTHNHNGNRVQPNNSPDSQNGRVALCSTMMDARTRDQNVGDEDLSSSSNL